jgi:hypothetical protein
MSVCTVGGPQRSSGWLSFPSLPVARLMTGVTWSEREESS